MMWRAGMSSQTIMKVLPAHTRSRFLALLANAFGWGLGNFPVLTERHGDCPDEKFSVGVGGCRI